MKQNSNISMTPEVLLNASKKYLDVIKKCRNKEFEKEIQRVMKPSFFGFIPGCKTREDAIKYLKSDDEFFTTYDRIFNIRYSGSEDVVKTLVKMAEYGIKTNTNVSVSREDFDIISDFV